MSKIEIRNINKRLLGMFDPETNAIEIANKDCLTVIRFLPKCGIEVVNSKRLTKGA